jgi:hypothetical protein
MHTSAPDECERLWNRYIHATVMLHFLKAGWVGDRARPHMHGSSLRWFVASCCFLGSSPAWAYLDPGTGSLIVQGLIAAVVGALVTGKLYWYKLKSFFSSRRGRGPGEDEPAAKADDSSSSR